MNPKGHKHPQNKLASIITRGTRNFSQTCIKESYLYRCYCIWQPERVQLNLKKVHGKGEKEKVLIPYYSSLCSKGSTMVGSGWDKKENSTRKDAQRDKVERTTKHTIPRSFVSLYHNTEPLSWWYQYLCGCHTEITKNITITHYS